MVTSAGPFTFVFDVQRRLDSRRRIDVGNASLNDVVVSGKKRNWEFFKQMSNHCSMLIESRSTYLFDDVSTLNENRWYLFEILV